MTNMLEELRNIIYSMDTLIGHWMDGYNADCWESDDGQSVYQVADNLRNRALSIIDQLSGCGDAHE